MLIKLPSFDEYDEQTQEYYREVYEQETAYFKRESRVTKRFRFVSFLSNSAGRKRIRKIPREVELITDGWTKETHTPKKTSFDTLASETYGNGSFENTEKLEKDIRKYCRV